MNFRLLTWWADAPAEVEHTTLRDFTESNAAVPFVVDRVTALEPGQVVNFVSSGLHVKRVEKTQPRFTRVRVPIKYDGAEYATVTIDRKRLTLAIRPARRRSVFELELPDFAQRMLERQAKLNVRARKLARRKARR